MNWVRNGKTMTTRRTGLAFAGVIMAGLTGVSLYISISRSSRT